MCVKEEKKEKRRRKNCVSSITSFYSFLRKAIEDCVFMI